MPDSNKTLMLKKDDVMVSFVNLGEGYNGDYNPDDPNDEELLRFDVYVKEGQYWIPVDDASYCTQIPVNTKEELLREALEILMKNFYDALHNSHDTSVKKLGEQMSWISIDNDSEIENDM